MKVFIKAISYYLPEKIFTNEELIQEFPDWTAEKVANKIGISKRHIAAENETSTDMAVKAGQKLFEEHNIKPKDVDFIMLCTQSPDYFLPTSACIVQNQLNIPTKSGAIDFNLGCSGFVYGLAMAKGMIIGGMAKNVLLITSETYSKFIHSADKSNRTIFGDAAAATLISSNGIAEIMDFDFGTDGSGAENLIVRSGGLRQSLPVGDVKFDESGNPISSDHLFMNGTEIFNFTLEMVPKLVYNTLSINNLQQEDIDLFVFHQANKYMLNFLRKKIKIPENRFFYYMDQVGNTVSSTIPIAINEAIKGGNISSSSNVLIAGFGVGYSWAGSILKF